MQVHVARPEGAPKAGIIVIQEAFGVTDYIERMTARFTAAGYLAVAPEVFHRSAEVGAAFSYDDFEQVKPHMAALTLEGQEVDLKASYDLLVREGAPKGKIAALGFCMGGRASFLANATLPLACAVSFYGGGISEQLLDRVDALSGPQLFFWGGKDAHILVEKTRAVADALANASKPFVDVTFSEADHAFARDVGAHYHKTSANEAWALADAFLADHLA